MGATKVFWRNIAASFLLTSLLAFAVTVIVSLLWNLIFEGSAAPDWGTALRMAIILGVVLTWIKVREEKQQQREKDTSVS